MRGTGLTAQGHWLDCSRSQSRSVQTDVKTWPLLVVHHLLKAAGLSSTGARSVSCVHSEQWGPALGKYIVFTLLESAFKIPVTTFQYL